MAEARKKKPRDGTPAPPVFDRMPPHNIEAERSVLGALLINGQAVGPVIEVFHENDPEIFYHPPHQAVFDAVVSLFRNNVPADMVTVAAELEKNGRLDEVGGPSYLSDLTMAVPTSANVEYYARIVMRAAMLRKLIVTCTQITGEAYQGGDEVEELLDTAEKRIFALNEQRQTNPIHHVGDLVKEGVAAIQSKMDNRSGINGLATGFPELDKMMSGLQKSDMIVLAARPSVGKTAFALNIAANAAIRDNKATLLFSLEMAKEQLVQRLLCLVGQVDMQKLRDGFMPHQEFAKVQGAAQFLSTAPIYIDETSGLTPLEMRSKARGHAARHPLDLVVIDYMQLMHTSGKSENRQNEIAEISRAIKGLARELRVPVLTLSQLSREAEKDDRGMPKMSHLRESGAIEQDADVVMILARPPAAEREEEKRDQVILQLAKQRNGPTGKLELLFRRNIQRFLPLDDKGAPVMPPPAAGGAPVPDPFEMDGAGYLEDDAPF